MEQKSSTGRLIKPGASPKEQQESDLGQLKVRGAAQATGTDRAPDRAPDRGPDRGPERPVREQQRTDGAQMRPGRLAGAQQGTERRNSAKNRTSQSREQRAQRKQRELEGKAREQHRKDELEQAKNQEAAGNNVDEQSAATRASQRNASVGDRFAGTDGNVDFGREADPNAGLEVNGTFSPDLGAAPSTGPDSAVGLDPDAAVDFAQATSQFANRAKFSQSALVQTILYFFANTPQPDRLDEEEEERILSEIGRLSPSEITPEKILELFMLGAISQEAMKRIEEKVLQLGEKAPATKEEIGAIAQKIIKLWKQADEMAFDPRNNN